VKRIGGVSSVGVVLAVLNVLAWVAFVRSTVPLETEFPGLTRSAPLAEPGSQRYDLNACSHCPMFVMLDRGILGGYWSLPHELLGYANLPGLLLASRERLRFGIRVVDPRIFFPLASLQWYVVGWVFQSWRRKLVTRTQGNNSVAPSA